MEHTLTLITDDVETPEITVVGRTGMARSPSYDRPIELTFSMARARTKDQRGWLVTNENSTLLYFCGFQSVAHHCSVQILDCQVTFLYLKLTITSRAG